MQVELPPTAQVLAEVIGPEKTVRLAQVCRCRSVYIPKRLKADHWLRMVIGDEDAQRLSDEFPGFTLPLAKCKRVVNHERNRNILKMYTDGLTYAEIARLMDMPKRTVQTIVYRAKNEQCTCVRQ